ncbi:MAG: hypothetical protein ABSF63_00290 [Candidatus Bathyarchaeia archaeon]|jgi:orotate phosphoribosyltransferase
MSKFLGPIDESNLREEVRGYFEAPGVIKRSLHLYRAGLEGPYYVDFDAMANDPLKCRHLVSLYAREIEKVSLARPMDYLGFIEKGSGGTIGALRLAAAISIATGIPNIPIRLTKEIRTETVKVGEAPFKKGRLTDRNIAIVTDHCTTGREILAAVDSVLYNGGSVTDVLAFSYVPDRLHVEDFQARNIVFHSIFKVPQDLPEVVQFSLAKDIAKWLEDEIHKNTAIMGDLDLFGNLGLLGHKVDELDTWRKEIDESLDEMAMDKVKLKLDEKSKRILRNEIVMAALLSSTNNK